LDHYARGGFVGLTMSHTKGHMARSVMEGVAFHLRWICEAMEKIGFNLDGFNAIGGGCNSPLWIQIISDVTRRPIHVVKNHLEAGAAGAALAVAVGLGIYADMDSVDDLIKIRREVAPNSANWKRYDSLYHEYRDIYEALVPIHKGLYQTP
jgi:xylulokinase